MSEKVALLFAGQGAQTVGMGRDLAEQFPTAADLFQQADEVLGRKLGEIAWQGPLEELTKTSNCQPALFVHGLVCLSILRELGGEFPIGGAAGLSLGEMTAHAAAGTFDFATGLKLVQRRGELMDEACSATNGAMAAMIGADESAVRALAADADVDVANINAPGQIVISGEKAKVEIAVGLAKEHGIYQRSATLLGGRPTNPCSEPSPITNIRTNRGNAPKRRGYNSLSAHFRSESASATDITLAPLEVRRNNPASTPPGPSSTKKSQPSPASRSMQSSQRTVPVT